MPIKPTHMREFSRFSKSYGKYNLIQKEVAKKLISKIKSKPKTILDLGCGDGAVYSLIDWEIERFIALDRSNKMCKLHPKDKNVQIICSNFDDRSIYDSLADIDLTIAASSLQWSEDIYKTIDLILKNSKEVAFAIFCDKTFKAIYDLSGIERFLPSSSKLCAYLSDLECEVSHYKLYFDDNLSKFRYIKRSGVSGGKGQLSFRETKRLIKDYPLDYLEFEVLFVWGESKYFQKPQR